MNYRTVLLCLGLSILACAQAAQPPKLFDSGPELVAHLLTLVPDSDLTMSGTMTIRQPRAQPVSIPIRYQLLLTPSNWHASFEAWPGTTTGLTLRVIFNNPNPPLYLISRGTNPAPHVICDGPELAHKFCDSDFLVSDLGLHFLYWPHQKLLKREMRRSRYCYVLESRPDPGATTHYLRVVSWIDTETFGLVRAEAYDHRNRILKEFEPKEFKKIRGQWELTEMQIRNRQTGSRTTIEFQPSDR